jgi:flagellar basal-body rod modification protein FlgD
MSVNATDIFANMGVARGSAASPPARSDEIGQSTFLLLMTEQLKHQDPLKPLDSNEFLGQLAQFSTVGGIEKMQNGLNALATAFEGAQALQAASLVGRSAMVAADTFDLQQPDGSIAGAVDVDDAGPVSIQIKDSSGRVVRTLSLQASGPGSQEFQWDGRDDSGELMASGQYSISASYGAGASAVAITPLIEAQIESVSYSAQGIYLNLAGIGPVPMSAVSRIS